MILLIKQIAIPLHTPSQLSKKSRHLVTAVTPGVLEKKWLPEDNVSHAKK